MTATVAPLSFSELILGSEVLIGKHHGRLRVDHISEAPHLPQFNSSVWLKPTGPASLMQFDQHYSVILVWKEGSFFNDLGEKVEVKRAGK